MSTRDDARATGRAQATTIEHDGSTDYLLAWLEWLDLLLRREVLRLRLSGNDLLSDEFRGLYISEEEVDLLLERPLFPTLPEAHSISARPVPGELDRLVEHASATIAEKEASLAREGERPRLVVLRDLFNLSHFDIATIVICLAAELDLKYERLYAYLQDDVTRKRPTVDLLLRLLGTTFTENIDTRRAFDARAPLQAWRLLSLHEERGAQRTVLLSRYLKLDDQILTYLLHGSLNDERLDALRPVQDAPGTFRRGNGNGEQGLSLSGAGVRLTLSCWIESWETTWQDGAPVLLFYGPYGTGRRAAAAWLAKGLGRPLLSLSAPRLAASPEPIQDLLILAERAALLSGGVLCWIGVDRYLEQTTSSDARPFLDAIARGTVPTILIAEKPWEPAAILNRRPFLSLEMHAPAYDEREQIWREHLTAAGASLPDEALRSLAGRFRLTGGQIQDAIARARTVAWARDPRTGQITLDDIDVACRAQSQHRLGTLARKLEPRYRWEDIVLPRPPLRVLQLICATLRQRPIVYGKWGFDRKLSLGKGMIALFSGPPGTGKTMAAEIIANELRLDLYKIDLSGIVSKYIGETEKNLERIFVEAEKSDAILFFDEADALFGKRSEVKDAHDRYANIETSYLLQRTEAYDGLVILASNLKKNMDEAFIRRIHFTIDFPFPEEAERLRIWQKTFPPETPRDTDIDYEFLARKFKVTGGHIRNIILTASFLAAEEHEAVGMSHLVRAAGYELQKIGKLVVERDFEHYFDLVTT